MIEKKYLKLFLLLPLLSPIKSFAAASKTPVDHSYEDHLNDRLVQVRENRTSLEQFPEKMHKLLSDAEEKGLQDVVSWMPHGRSFKVHQKDKFLEIASEYFSQTKLSSFQRQLTLYGFKRITNGPDKGSYYHELFLRSRLDLSLKIKRLKLKGHKRLKDNPQQEPKFYEMVWATRANYETDAIGPINCVSNSEQSLKEEEDEDSALDFFVNMLEDGDYDDYGTENTDCSGQIEEQEDEYFGVDFFERFRNV